MSANAALQEQVMSAVDKELGTLRKQVKDLAERVEQLEGSGKKTTTTSSASSK